MQDEQRRTARIRDLLDEALDLPTGDRAAFLEIKCGTDRELRSEIESLLEAHERHRGFLDVPLIPSPPSSSEDSRVHDDVSSFIGRQIGRYVIRRLIGVGGMGAVFEAEQEEPRRTVAVKVMRLRLPSRSGHRRFRQEVMILGRLNHPNIAQIIEAGTHYEDTVLDGGDGLPYFVMEFIRDARPVTKYAVEEQLSTRDRLVLFKTICDAVHHGHQKGVIHRDLKPANIVINDEGRPKIIDFGVARISEQSLDAVSTMTDVGQLIGTIQYMSPEQMDGDPHDLDIRSDVYSLGIVLFELLSGELPYDLPTSSVFQASRMILEQAPRSLSSVRPEWKGDLTAIVSKAIAKDRGRRYRSAAELGRDVERYLNGEPIEARAPSVWERAMRLFARHPVITASITTTVVVLLITITPLLTFTSLTNISFISRPVNVLVSREPNVARLVSQHGVILHEWRDIAGQQIWDARFIRHAAGSRVRSIVVTAWGGPDYATPTGTVCAYDVDSSFVAPIWETHVTDDNVPAPLREDGYCGGDFGARYLDLIDIFPEIDGPEVVVIYHHTPRSGALLRIISLDGRVLYEIWHNGHLSPPYWMSDAKLLVMAGFSSAATWNERVEASSRLMYPTIAFAVRPQIGFQPHGWCTNEDVAGADSRTLAWYHCLLPADLAEYYSINNTRRPSRIEEGTGRRAGLILSLRGYTSVSEIWATIDEAGHFDRESLTPNIEMLQALDADPQIPRPDGLYLGDLPPIIVAPDDTPDDQ